MTDTNLPTPEVHICPAGELREQLRTLDEQLNGARRQLRQIRENLWEGLRQVEDTDFQDQLKDFLENNTGWDFELNIQYRVKISGYVTVMARNEEDALEAVENANWHWDDDVEPDSFETIEATEA